MSHIESSQWLQYVANELDDKTRQSYEDHLYHCDQCLKVYMEAVSVYEQTFPKIAHDTVVTTIMQEISRKNEATNKGTSSPNAQKRPFYQKSLFHYVIAAVLTLVFMSSGIFSQLTQMPGQFEARIDNEQNVPLTEQLMDQTLSWLKVTERNKEANE